MKTFLYSALAAIVGVFLGYQTRPSISPEIVPEKKRSNPLTSIGLHRSIDQHKRLTDTDRSPEEEEEFAESFARAWAREDPLGGLEWTSKPGPRKRWVRLAFIREWNRLDPDAVRAHLRGLPSSEELYFDVFDNWIAYDDDEIVGRALDWYDAQPEEARTEILSLFPESTVIHDPGGVLKWTLQQQPESDEASDAGVGDELFSGGARNYWQEQGAKRALDTWLKRDEAAAREWLFEEAETELRDHLLTELGYTHSDYFPPIPSDLLLNQNRYSVYELQAQISDPELRWKSLRRTMGFEHSSSAQKHLDASDLPEALRADLQELIDAGETNDALYSD